MIFALLFPLLSFAGYFAEVDVDGNVIRVIVADQAFVDSQKLPPGHEWMETDVDKNGGRGKAGPGWKWKPTTGFMRVPHNGERPQ